MSLANATLTSHARLRLARLIVDQKWVGVDGVKDVMVAPPTARK